MCWKNILITVYVFDRTPRNLSRNLIIELWIIQIWDDTWNCMVLKYVWVATTEKIVEICVFELFPHEYKALGRWLTGDKIYHPYVRKGIIGMIIFHYVTRHILQAVNCIANQFTSFSLLFCLVLNKKCDF